MNNCSFLNEKNVLITGATGLLGSNLARFLHRNSNCRLFLLGRSREKLSLCFSDILGERVVLIESDICSFSFEFNVPINFIFHAAGSADSNLIKNSPVSIIKPNIIGTINCLEFLIKQKELLGVNGRFVLFSSVTVYGGGADYEKLFSEDETKIESDYLRSDNASYAESKKMSELITKSYIKQYDVDAIILRFSTVYGYSFFKQNSAFYSFITCLQNGSDIIIQNANPPKRDNIYIDDAINGIIVATNLGPQGEVYNVSSGGEKDNLASVVDIVKMMVRVSCSNSPVVLSGDGCEKRSLFMPILNNSKLKTLGWDCLSSLEEGISKTFDFYSIKRKTNV